MILFGRKAHHLALKELNENHCQKCHRKKIVMSVFQKYFHVLWLPIFPTKKSCATQCLKCRDVQIESNFDEVLKQVAKTMKKEHDTPFWIFSGLLVLAFALLLKMVL